MPCCSDEGKGVRKWGSGDTIRATDPNDTGFVTLEIPCCARGGELPGSRRVLWAGNLDAVMFPQVIDVGVLPEGVLGVRVVCEEFANDVSMLALKYGGQELDATGAYITLTEDSGSLREALEATEAAAGCRLDCSKSTGKKVWPVVGCLDGDGDVGELCLTLILS